MDTVEKRILRKKSKNKIFEVIDPYSEKDTEVKFLNSKPICFIILGKPGAGCTTIAKLFAEEFRCEYINPKDLIQEHLTNLTEKGKELQTILVEGGVIENDIVLQLIKEKIASPEVTHHGYILDGFPVICSESLSPIEQFEVLKSFDLQPDFLIYMKIPFSDLVNRLTTIRFDPEDGKVYFKQNYDPDFPPPLEVPPPVIQKKPKTDDDEEEAAEEEEDEVMEEGEEGMKANPDFPLLEPETIKRLLKRPEEFEENITWKMKKYADDTSQMINDYIDTFKSSRVINLNSLLPPQKITQQLVERLKYYPDISPAAVVTPLYHLVTEGEDEEREDEDEPPEDVEDADELFRELSTRNIPARGFRWQRSEWDTFCPVALYEGIMTQGKPRFAVGFLNKVYLLSSVENLKRFTRNPRPYLLPPENPKIPCKLVIEGPAGSGKSSVSHLLAKHYNATVIDVQELVRPEMEKARTQFMAESLEKAKKQSIEIVKKQIRDRMEKERAERMADTAMNALRENAVEAVEVMVKEKLVNENAEEKEENDKLSEKTLDSVTVQEEVVKDLPEKLPEIYVDEHNDQARELIGKFMEEAERTPVTLPNDVYFGAIEKAVLDADEKLRAANKGGRLHGSWIIDNFPANKDLWTMILESNPEKYLVPNQVIVLQDGSEDRGYLLKIWYQNNKQMIDQAIAARLGGPPELNPDQDPLMPPPGPESVGARQKIENWVKEWDGVANIITNGTVPVEIIEVPIENLNVEDVNRDVIKKLNKIFELPATEWTDEDAGAQEEDEGAMMEEAADEEAEEEAGEEEEEGNEEEPNLSKNKPLGDTNYWCPVALNLTGVLWPGDPEIAAKYQGKMYYFSSEEYRTLFTENPKLYIPVDSIPKAPAKRFFILGAKGSGKTTIGRDLAEELHVFHISFHELLQEYILPKNRKKIGPEYNEDQQIPDIIYPDPALDELERANDEKTNDEYDVDTEKKTETKAEDEKKADEKKADEKKADEEGMEEWDESENAIKDYLTEQTPLPTEVMSAILADFWNKEPYKSVGFVMEGFPKMPDEVQFIKDSGLFVDAAIVLKYEEDDDDVISRLLKPRMDKWRIRKHQKDINKLRKKDYKAKLKQFKYEKRRKELLADLEQKRLDRAMGEDEGMGEDEEDINEEINIDEKLAEDFAEEEEEEEEEQEEELEDEAETRMRDEITEIVNQDIGNLEGVIESLQEIQIPRVVVDAAAKIGIVKYRLKKKLKKILDHRPSIFERCYPVSVPVAEKLIKLRYKQLSCFGRWCPVRLVEENDPIVPLVDEQHPTFPVIYRSHIYFCSSKKARDEFMINPLQFLQQPLPKDFVPIKLCILGMNKCGKTTLANRFIKQYGLTRITGGEAVRKILNEQWNSNLAKIMRSYLIKGLIVPHELIVQSMDMMLLDVKCITRGYVLDAYPVHVHQVELLYERGIVPNRVFEVIGNPSELVMRAMRDKFSESESAIEVLPRHDSSRILAMQMANYDRHISDIRKWYGYELDNIRSLDSYYAKWKTWEVAIRDVKEQIRCIQNYMHNRERGLAASIHNIGVRPSEFQARLSQLQHYCPVRLVRHNELVNMKSETSLKCAAEFGGHYYIMSGPEELAEFLQDAEAILAEAKLPEHLPSFVEPDFVNLIFPTQLAIQGYCPVCFLEGKRRYEGLVLGNKDQFVTMYRDLVFAFCSEKCQNLFMKKPAKFWDLELPKKLPPLKNPINVRSLPLPGYLEQTVADALRNALTATGTLKPKYPFINPSRSALLYIALHLKAYNVSSVGHLSEKYKRKLEEFENHCELIKYLSDHMTLKYKEVEQRAAGFDKKMKDFLNLKNLQDNEERWIGSK